MTKLAAVGSGDAVRMQYRAEEERLAAARMKVDGDRVGALLEGNAADKLAEDAALVLDPVLHTRLKAAGATDPSTLPPSAEIASAIADELEAALAKF